MQEVTKLFSLCCSLSLVSSLLVISACSEPEKALALDDKLIVVAMKAPVDVEIGSLDDLKLNFTVIGN